MINKLINKLRGFTRNKVSAVKPKTILVGKFLLEADYNCKLHEYLNAHPNYSINLARLIACTLKEKPNSLIIDVGANIGDTAALIRSQNIHNPILCIEGNEIYLNFLKRNLPQFKNITIIETFLGAKNENINGTVVTNEGTAKIMISSIGESIPIQTLDKIIFEKKINDIGLLKIDTDGFDIPILKGSQGILSAQSPILFFEYDPTLNTSDETCLSFILSLGQYGYSKVFFYDNYGNFLICLNLVEEDQISQLDNYINKGKAPFQYFDVAVFHKKDEALANRALKNLNPTN